MSEIPDWPDAGYLTRRYSVGRSTFYRWVKEGFFPKPARIGKSASRWSANEVRAFEARALLDRGSAR